MTYQCLAPDKRGLDGGFKLPPSDHAGAHVNAGETGAGSGQVTTTTYAVQDVFYYVHRKHGASDEAPKTMRVDYKVGFNAVKSEWICFEHAGFARYKAEKWWRRRSPDSVPATAQYAVDIANNGGVALTTGITVRMAVGDQFERIIAYVIGPMPVTLPRDDSGTFDPDEVPF